jgi:hypothetical protein
MTPHEARVGATVRASGGCQSASAGTVGKIVRHYFLGLSIHAVSVRWEVADPDAEPTIIPRDHLAAIELVETDKSQSSEGSTSPSFASSVSD